MNPFEKEKAMYDNIRIPDELSERVNQELEKAKFIKHSRPHAKVYRSCAAVAASFVVLFVAGLNCSQAFAQGMGSVPVIGKLAKVLTFKTYEETTDDMNIAVDIPSVEMIAEDQNGLEASLNEEIYNRCEEYADAALERAREYREAFLETGGTEEEWAEKNVEIKVQYEVKTLTDQYLSFVVTGTESWVSAYSEETYYNIELTTGSLVSLKELIGENYKDYVNQEIASQVEDKEADSVFEYSLNQWQGIDDDTSFYINENGNPVVVIPKGEIAPEAAGSQEFEIELN